MRLALRGFTGDSNTPLFTVPRGSTIDLNAVFLNDDGSLVDTTIPAASIGFYADRARSKLLYTEVADDGSSPGHVIVTVEGNKTKSLRPGIAFAFGTLNESGVTRISENPITILLG